MIEVKKYPRTPHFPFSLGAKNDDRISKTYNSILSGEIICSEKIDGSNLSMSRYGIFGRSRASETNNPWDNWIKPKYQMIKNDLGDLEICGENMYGEHSIIYSGLDSHFYVFGIRDMERNMWLSWDEVEFYSNMLDFLTVPILLKTEKTFNSSENEMKNMIFEFMKTPSLLSDDRFWITEKEGVVVRIKNEFQNDDFEKYMFKNVRQNHVQTDDHWQRNWKRAFLKWELEKINIK